jgi:hypothetical protein
MMRDPLASFGDAAPSHPGRRKPVNVSVKNIGWRRIILGNVTLFPGDVRDNVPMSQVVETNAKHPGSMAVNGQPYPAIIVPEQAELNEATPDPVEQSDERQPEQPDQPPAKRGSRKK